jgi:putative intracellular protease/amidase
MKRVLFLISEWGYWGSELLEPLRACDDAGYESTFVTPTGGRPTPLSASADSAYVEPSLGRAPTGEETAAGVRVLDASERVADPISLAGWFPERPYPSSPRYLRELETYHERAARIVEEELAAYDALVLVGGSGAMVDLVNDQRVHELVRGFAGADKPVVAQSQAVATFLFARDPDAGHGLVCGRHVTGPPLVYDRTSGTILEGLRVPGSTRTGSGQGAIDVGPTFYPLEHLLRDAVGPEGRYIGRIGHRTCVLVDHPFVTSRCSASAVECGRMLVEVLEHGLRRSGW